MDYAGEMNLHYYTKASCDCQVSSAACGVLVCGPSSSYELRASREQLEILGAWSALGMEGMIVRRGPPLMCLSAGS
eukprot:3926086-Amphidinium_carterae.2